ncbi:hypothetical protein N0V95_007053 [Ascochyta clinopodiicola]|nr:hypothetical protein N0V95_007053 [Ascochyta clinopodiicola]
MADTCLAVDKNNASRSKSMAEACRDLLKLVLAEAGLTKDSKQDLPRLLIDVGFGCGEQTIHLMSDKPIRQCDELWWDAEDHQVYFNQYIGITQDKSQYQYAQDRVDEFICSSVAARVGNTSLFCADAASPTKWNEDLLAALNKAKSESLETWLLALDSAYHFSPSRWVFIEQAHREFGASFMAFDLCLSPNATTLQKLILRVLTTLMGAPWANFVTPELYRQQLRQTGYNDDFIKIIDISEHVFEPLAGYLDKQDYQLKTLGLGLGRFKAAKSLFRWWEADVDVRLPSSLQERIVESFAAVGCRLSRKSRSAL